MRTMLPVPHLGQLSQSPRAHSETCSHLPAAHKAQLLKDPLAVCKLGEVGSQGGASDVHYVNADFALLSLLSPESL